MIMGESAENYLETIFTLFSSKIGITLTKDMFSSATNLSFLEIVSNVYIDEDAFSTGKSLSTIVIHENKNINSYGNILGNSNISYVEYYGENLLDGMFKGANSIMNFVAYKITSAYRDYFLLISSLSV